MKPKHRWGRNHKKTYSTLRQYIHYIKQNDNKFIELRIVRGKPLSLFMVPKRRLYTNNRLKMTGKPMIRRQQMHIARKRYRIARERRIINYCMEDW